MSRALRVLPYGDRGVLLEVATTADVLGLAAALRAGPPPGVVDVVPAARTVLLTVDGGRPAVAAVAEQARRLRWEPGAGSGPGHEPPEPVELAVRYDGADLAEVAGMAGLSGPDEVVRRHTAAAYTVAFSGFVPGFAYLAGGDPALRVPRRDTPRTRVPAGSVAVAGEWTGVYPRRSPGGWRLLGRTDAPLWDAERDPPALLVPGAPVRLVARS